MRFDSSKTCGMLWLIRMTLIPRLFIVWTSSSTSPRFADPQGGCRLVEDNDPPPKEHGSAYCDALALAS